MDAADLDLEDLPPKALRKLIKGMLAKMGKPANDKDVEEADDERQKLADLHEEHKGKAPRIPVQKEDLPLHDSEEDEDEVEDPSEIAEEEECCDEDMPAKPKKKAPPFVKKKGGEE